MFKKYNMSRKRREIFQIINNGNLSGFKDLYILFPEISNRRILEHVMNATVNHIGHSCVSGEGCLLCGMFYCKNNDPLHFSRGGCPTCVPQHTNIDIDKLFETHKRIAVLANTGLFMH